MFFSRDTGLQVKRANFHNILTLNCMGMQGTFAKIKTKYQILKLRGFFVFRLLGIFFLEY